VQRLVAEARERMLGRPMQSALYHADLRAKHVGVRADGSLVGILDWGASERAFVPYVDLLQLVLHQRKQEEGGSLGAAAAILRAPGRMRAHERAALERYCSALRLDPEVRQGIESLYPVFVAGMAERNWDYSRPDWLHRSFGL
jgi:aminoglycoside phosphotransferase (APT) family kinase protein